MCEETSGAFLELLATRVLAPGDGASAALNAAQAAASLVDGISELAEQVTATVRCKITR